MYSLSVSMAAWLPQNTDVQAHCHPCVPTAIPLTANFSLVRARAYKLMLTPSSSKLTVRCWGTFSIWMAGGHYCCLLPPSCLLTRATKGLPGKQREGKTMTRSTFSFYILLLSPPPSELKNPPTRKLRWKRLKSLLPSLLLRLRNRNIS